MQPDEFAQLLHTELSHLLREHPEARHEIARRRLFCLGNHKEDFNKGQSTQVNTKFEDRFFQEEKLYPGNDARFDTGIDELPIQLTQS